MIRDHDFKGGKFSDLCTVQLARYPCSRPRSEHLGQYAPRHRRDGSAVLFMFQPDYVARHRAKA